MDRSLAEEFRSEGFDRPAIAPEPQPTSANEPEFAPAPSAFSDADEPVIVYKPRIKWETIAAVMAIVAGVLWVGTLALRGARSESIHRIRNHAATYDGRSIEIRGRVADVFDLGGSTTYLLRQGRDSIVVFRRGPAPERGSTITVRGSISVGVLDGVPRPAIFESSSSH